MQPRSRLDFSGRDRYRLAMAITVGTEPSSSESEAARLRPAGRARLRAALAANRLVEATGSSWDEILTEKPATKVVVQRVRDWDIDHLDAAEARIRQLKSTTERRSGKSGCAAGSTR